MHDVVYATIPSSITQGCTRSRNGQSRQSNKNLSTIMSSTPNTTESLEKDFADTLFLKTGYIFCAGLSMLILVVIVAFILILEIRKSRDSNGGLNHLVTSFNISLLGASWSLTGFYASFATLNSIQHDLLVDGTSWEDSLKNSNVNTCRFFYVLCFSVFETSYLAYSWLRAAPILEDVFPRNHKHIEILVKILPVVFLIAIVPDIAGLFIPFSKLALIYNLIVIVGALGLLSMDIVMMVAFANFVGRTRVEGQDQDKRFLIISRSGIASSGFAVLSLLLFAAYSVLPQWVLFGFASHVCLILVVGVLFVMKLLLHTTEMARISKATAIRESVEIKERTGSRIQVETNRAARSRQSGSYNL